MAGINRLTKGGTMARRVAVALVVILVLGLAGAAVAAEVSGSGTQIRGNAGRNAQLKAAPFSLAKSAKVVAAEDGGAGFWIEKQGGGTVKTFDKAKDAVGFQLGAGTYYVYPNLKPNQDSATVRLKFRD
jgi:hypothetical protein